MTVVGPKKSIPNVIILGPARSAAQVEVSLTDARSLGVTAPVRERRRCRLRSCKLVGPCGEVELTEGVIAAKRHIHLDPATAETFGLEDKQVVSAKIDSDERSTVFGDVVCRKPQIRSRDAHRHRRIERSMRIRRVLRRNNQIIFENGGRSPRFSLIGETRRRGEAALFEKRIGGAAASDRHGEIMIKAIIFDLDGTLCDTMEDLREAMNAMLRSFGWAKRSARSCSAS